MMDDEYYCTYHSDVNLHFSLCLTIFIVSPSIANRHQSVRVTIPQTTLPFLVSFKIAWQIFRHCYRYEYVE